jgi:hypothetical protein
MSSVDEQLYEAVLRDDLLAARGALNLGACASYVHTDEKQWVRVETAVLFIACEKKNAEMVNLLLAHGANPNGERYEHAVWGSERDPCVFAAIPSEDIVKELLEKGADPNVPRASREDCHTEETALQAVQGNPELLRLLKQHGAREA